MDLYHSISRRKSCRKYRQELLTTSQLDEIKKVLDSFEPLYPDAPIEYRFTSGTKGLFQVKAPHYLVFSGKGKDGEQENAGFIGQKLMLWLNAHELGGVWLGASRDATKQRSRSDIIVLAFGKPEGSPHRKVSEFKRKPISEITNAVEDECIKAVHLAPSGINIQPWYLQKKEDTLKFYRQILKPPMSLAYKLTHVDMGIALCHYAVACDYFGKSFNFCANDNGEAIKGYEFIGEIN
jgi:nitroreductase